MSLLKLLGLALGLAMDAFAVSITSGLTMQKLKVRYALRIALFFGVFQALMPIIGYLAGLSVRELIENYDHWVAFGLLAFVGGKMLWEGFSSKDDEDACTPKDPTRGTQLLLLAIATSIDALAVGLALAMLDVVVWLPALVIGLVACAFTVAGLLTGARSGARWGRRVEVAGGAILIAIGLKILLSALFFDRAAAAVAG